MIIAVRKQLLDADTNLRDHGKGPPNVDNIELDKVRSGCRSTPTGRLRARPRDKRSSASRAPATCRRPCDRVHRSPPNND